MLVLWGVSKIVGPYPGFALLSETVKFLMFENLRHPARGLVFKVYVLMAQIPNLSFGLWTSKGEITYPAHTTSEKKINLRKTSGPQLFLARRFCGVRSFRAPFLLD